MVKFESEVWEFLLYNWKVHDKRIELYSLVGILLAFEYGLLVVSYRFAFVVKQHATAANRPVRARRLVS